jgi:hypothetical protein
MTHQISVWIEKLTASRDVKKGAKGTGSAVLLSTGNANIKRQPGVDNCH